MLYYIHYVLRIRVLEEPNAAYCVGPHFVTVTLLRSKREHYVFMYCRHDNILF